MEIPVAVKKDKEVRQRIESIFNRREEEFETKREYDDYLEEREDIIFNLVEGIDVEETNARVREYQTKNAENIAENEARKAKEIFLASQAAEESPLMAEYDGEVPAAMTATDGRLYGGHPIIEPLAPLPDEAAVRDILGKQTREEWTMMAVASGWSPAMQKRKCIDTFKSLFIL